MSGNGISRDLVGPSRRLQSPCGRALVDARTWAESAERGPGSSHNSAVSVDCVRVSIWRYVAYFILWL